MENISTDIKWEAGYARTAIRITSSYGEEIAIVCAGNKHKKAHARLIAAAPQMLAALNYLAQCSEPMTDQQEECWKLIRTVIAKATSEASV